MVARIRSLKPEALKHEELFDLEESTGLPMRVAYFGLWTQMDREGRFKWRPRSLKLDILPYDDVPMSKVLEALEGSGFIKRYEVDGKAYGWCPSFRNHQSINHREAQSTLPPHPDDPDNKPPGTARDACTTRSGLAPGERNGREQNRTEPTSGRVGSAGKRFPGSSREWDSCLALMREMRFDDFAQRKVSESGLDDMDIERTLKDAKHDGRVRKKAGWVLKTIGAAK